MRLLHRDALNPHSIPPGQPYRWDDPNLFFGSDGLGYAREPGDTGFVPYLPTNSSLLNQRHTPTKKMRHNAYYPMAAAEQILWLTNFYVKLIGHAITLGISSAAVADARWIIYILSTWQPAQRQWAKACTDAVKEAQTGESGMVMELPVFTPPPLPVSDVANDLPAVVPVMTGALSRLFSLAQVIQEAPGYNDTLGTDLGTIGSAATSPDLNLVQQEISVEIRGPHVFVGWGWTGLSAYLDMCQLQVDRGTCQGYVDLAYDTTPGYLATAPHPAALTRWKYRGIFRVGDSQVGLWSPEASLAVGG